MVTIESLRVQQDHELTRAILSSLGGEETSFSDFCVKMREEHHNMTVGRMRSLFSAYCEFDGVTKPYLSIETGKRL